MAGKLAEFSNCMVEKQGDYRPITEGAKTFSKGSGLVGGVVVASGCNPIAVAASQGTSCVGGLAVGAAIVGLGTAAGVAVGTYAKAKYCAEKLKESGVTDGDGHIVDQPKTGGAELQR